MVYISYLSSRSFTVNAAGLASNPYTLTYHVPQGSVLGPLLSILYTYPLSKLISSSSAVHHFYANDTQLFISSKAETWSWVWGGRVKDDRRGAQRRAGGECKIGQNAHSLLVLRQQNHLILN